MLRCGEKSCARCRPATWTRRNGRCGCARRRPRTGVSGWCRTQRRPGTAGGLPGPPVRYQPGAPAVVLIGVAPQLCPAAELVDVVEGGAQDRAGCRHRQLRVRALLAGMMLTQADHRPAQLTRVRDALIALPGPEPGAARRARRPANRPAPADLPADRPDLQPDRRCPRQRRTCRAAAGSAAAPLRRPAGGIHPGAVQGRQPVAGGGLDRPGILLPAPPARGGPCADLEASWGHRKNSLLRSQDELFYGYYLSAAIMMPDENVPTSVPTELRVLTNQARRLKS
jgi:hypothetical protein